jgi:hypothetical protein
MKPMLPLIALLLATPVLAQEGPGSHFVTNWDLDGNGAVSLAEATERRGDIFVTFDADEDGQLSASEYDAFDAARAADREGMMQGQGQGKGQGQGQGRGKGRGMGDGMDEEGGMMRGFNDGNSDGTVSREEFLARVPDWFAMMDRDGDGNVTEADFGPGN